MCTSMDLRGWETCNREASLAFFCNFSPLLSLLVTVLLGWQMGEGEGEGEGEGRGVCVTGLHSRYSITHFCPGVFSKLASFPGEGFHKRGCW